MEVLYPGSRTTKLIRSTWNLWTGIFHEKNKTIPYLLFKNHKSFLITILFFLHSLLRFPLQLLVTSSPILTHSRAEHFHRPFITQTPSHFIRILRICDGVLFVVELLVVIQESIVFREIGDTRFVGDSCGDTVDAEEHFFGRLNGVVEDIDDWLDDWNIIQKINELKFFFTDCAKGAL